MWIVFLYKIKSTTLILIIYIAYKYVLIHDTVFNFQNLTVFHTLLSRQTQLMNSWWMTQHILTCLWPRVSDQEHSVQIKPQLTVWLFLLCAAELIKKHELEKDELRPLYMDFQATTPMVTVTNHVFPAEVRELLTLTCTYSFTRVYLCVGPPGAGRHVALPGELLW